MTSESKKTAREMVEYAEILAEEVSQGDERRGSRQHGPQLLRGHG